MRARGQFESAYGIALTRRKHVEIVVLLLCLELVTAFSYLGFIQLPPISITTLSILVIVAAMYFGPLEALAVSLVFAMASMWKASLTSVEIGDIIFSPILSGQPFDSLVLAVGTRVLFALIAGFMFRWFFSKKRKYRRFGISAIAVVATAIHALLVYVCMVVFFGADQTETSSSFDQSLLLSNIVFYCVTVAVVLVADYMMRRKDVRRFFAQTSTEKVQLSKEQSRTTVIVTVVITLFCVLICLHFMSRLVQYLSTGGASLGAGTDSRVFALVVQFAIGFFAAFGILALLMRWMQEYSSVLMFEANMRARENREIASNYARFFTLEDDFESLYDVELESGAYTSYVKGDFYQSNVIDKLVEPTDYFEDLRANIDAVIYPDDRDGLYNALTRDAIRRQLAEAEHFDFYYRLITNDGPEWFRMRIVYKDGQKESVIIGVFDAQEEMALKERTDRLIAAFANENEVSILFDLEENAFTLLSNKGMIPESITGLLSGEASNLKYAERFVHPDDRWLFNDDIYTAEGARDKLPIGESYSFEYRGKIVSEYLWYRATFTRISENEVIVGYRNCNDEILYRHMSEKIIADFASVFVVNIDNDTYRFVSRNGESGFADVPGGVYSETIREYISRVNPDYREYWYNMCDLGNVRETLAREGRLEFEYPLEGVGKRWRRCVAQVLESENGIPNSFVMTFFAVDDSTAENLELNAQIAKQKDEIEEDMQMIGGLASGYHALYYINIDEGFFKVFSLDGKKLPKAAAIVDKGGDPFEVFRDFATSELVHPEDRYLFASLSAEELRERLAHSKKFTIRFRRNFNGEYRWSEMDVVKYEDVDERVNVVAVGFADRDKEIRAEREQQLALENALRAAEEANRSKSSFLFNMSHDIRTPMNAITGFTAMAKKYASDEQAVTSYLDKIDVSGKQLLSLVNQVLEMARIESGQIELNEQPVNVRREFNIMTTVLAEQAQENGQIFNFALKDVEHFNVFADESRMSSIMLNIAGNALKYTPKGGTIDFVLREVPARKPGYATLVLTVEDTGIGMSEEFLKIIYEPFAREKNSTVSKIQGTGLGMPIVKNLVNLMGGNIEVHSEPGVGTRFDITIDFKINENADEAEEAAPVELPDVFKGLRVLLVEDNELNREIAVDILEEEGLEVEEAEDGAQAVEMLRSKGPDYYDFVLMDIQMPVMDGYEATREIRRMYPDARIPIIAVSANAFEEDRRASREAGMDDHVAKPIEIKELFAALSKHIR